MPGGPLSAQHGEDIVPIINNIRRENDDLFATVVQVQDVHCPDDVAFASQHPGTKPFQTITLYYNNKGMIASSFVSGCCLFGIIFCLFFRVFFCFCFGVIFGHQTNKTALIAG